VVPEPIRDRIRAKKTQPDHPLLPTYYAVLILDGDRMGKWLQGRYASAAEQLPPGDVIQTTISRALAQFAVTKAPSIVEGPGGGGQGTLVYSGGDDVLAMMPTETVLNCAARLHDEYGRNWPKDELRASEVATLSAGIAVVHHKEDLRFVLDAARRAEKSAKGAGRDALTLTICRRSGEHTSALISWDMVKCLQQLVEIFRKRATDRWTYTLRRELPALSGEDLPWNAVNAEINRLVGRIEEPLTRTDLKNWVGGFLDPYRKTMTEERGYSRAKVLQEFVTLCQSASFLARGRDNR
jgi:CRISPR-associated protein Cmr2